MMTTMMNLIDGYSWTLWVAAMLGVIIAWLLVSSYFEG